MQILQNGQTPLHMAAARGYDMVVLALLQGGVDVNMKTRVSEYIVFNHLMLSNITLYCTALSVHIY